MIQKIRRGLPGPWILLAVGFLCVGCFSPVRAPQQQERARYIFLFIGDGMGLTQRMTAEIYLSGPARPGEELKIPRLKMNTLPVAGLTRTASWDGHITDSAAAATAMATGRKTRNGRLSMDPIKETPFPTFAEIMLKQGWRVGLVSSSPIDDATPGAFYAHEPSRGNRYAIAMAAAHSGITYLAGGGPVGAIPEEGDPRESPLARARANGFRLVHNRADLLAIQPGGGPVWAFRAGADGLPRGMSFDRDRDPTEPSLAEYTRKGIELLDNETGVFLMVEGGLSDVAGHGNCLVSVVHEVLALDAAVEEALRFYARHPEETLILVTGDHETGGLSLGSARSNHDLLRARVDGQTVRLSGVVEALSGWRTKQTPFEEVLPQLLEMTGWPEISPQELAEFRVAYAESLKGLAYPDRTPEVQRAYGTGDPLQVAIFRKTAGDSGLTWTTGGHSGQPVMTTAAGVGSRPFGSYHENTDIFRFLMTAAGMKLPEPVGDE